MWVGVSKVRWVSGFRGLAAAALLMRMRREAVWAGGWSGSRRWWQMRGCGEVPGDQFSNHYLSCGSETVVLGGC